MLLPWASRRFRGAALENSRDSPGRTEIKPKGKYKWRKRKAGKQAWRRTSKSGGRGGKEKGNIKAKVDPGEADNEWEEGDGEKWLEICCI